MVEHTIKKYFKFYWQGSDRINKKISNENIVVDENILLKALTGQHI